MRAVNNRKGCV